ncbi:uncharacterized protein [Henckelia pumila]|uniref:uncharacterized protein n=1 Tax=Henckelia pumila TaxID=405737 RepID=UPI003C6DD0A3
MESISEGVPIICFFCCLKGGELESLEIEKWKEEDGGIVRNLEAWRKDYGNLLNLSFRNVKWKSMTKRRIGRGDKGQGISWDGVGEDNDKGVMDIQPVFLELHGSGKLDGQNYAMWHRKIRFLLHKEKLLDHLTTVMAKPTEPKDGSTPEYVRDLDAYDKWVDQDKSARFTMLSCMHDNLIRKFEKHRTTKELWEILKVKYGSTSVTRLRALTLKFNQYVLDPSHSMIQHLDVM